MAISRDIECDNIHGGIAEFYIFEYVKYARSQVTVENNYLTLFPFVAIYNLNSIEQTFTETVDSEDGGTTFTQSGGFQLNKILPTDNYKQFVDRDWRIIIKDNNGFYRLIGLETGLKLKHTKETGSAIGQFNGFKFTFDTKEENTAPYLNDLSGFIVIETPTIGLQHRLQYTL